MVVFKLNLLVKVYKCLNVLRIGNQKYFILKIIKIKLTDIIFISKSNTFRFPTNQSQPFHVMNSLTLFLSYNTFVLIV